ARHIRPLTLAIAPTRRTLRALALMMVCPSVTWPSPAMTTLPPLRTVKMVVPCQVSSQDPVCRRLHCDIGMASPYFKLLGPSQQAATMALFAVAAYKRPETANELINGLAVN